MAILKMFDTTLIKKKKYFNISHIIIIDYVIFPKT